MKRPLRPKPKYTVRIDELIALILIFVLLISTATLSYLYWKDRKQRDLLLKQVQEIQKKLDHLQAFLAEGDLKKAFTELTLAQNNIADLLPRTAETKPNPLITQAQAPSPSPAPATPAPAVKPPSSTPPAQPVQAPAPPKSPPLLVPAKLTMAADEGPYPFILAEADEYLIAVEKDQKTLHLFRYTDNRFLLVKSYPCIVGANGLDKKKEGDLATPVGNYFSLRYIPGKSLPEKYGYGAFVLNYPNFLDRKALKEGTGIWLHGHTPEKSLGDPELQNTKGCVAVNNDALKELTGLIKVSGTPFVVVNRLQFAKASSQRQLSEELNAFMRSWAKAWESGKTEPFISHYSPDFINSDGMNYQSFKQQKEKVNSGKKFIRVKIENQAILLPQEKEGQIAVIRFMQRYRSNNFENDARKIFYLKKGQAGWQIIGESRL